MKHGWDQPFWLLILVLLAGSERVRADDWPQWLGPKRDAVWRESGILDRFPEGGPRILWRAQVGRGYSGPIVSGGKVFITDRGEVGSRASTAGDTEKKAGGKVERLLCFGETDGRLLWHQ